MTVNLNNNTLVNWKATTNDKIACALLFKSSASGSGTNDELSRARIYDPTETTANVISSSVANQTDYHLNPFTDALDYSNCIIKTGMFSFYCFLYSIKNNIVK